MLFLGIPPLNHQEEVFLTVGQSDGKEGGGGGSLRVQYHKIWLDVLLMTATTFPSNHIDGEKRAVMGKRRQ